MTIPRLASVARFDPSNLFRPTSIAVVGLESEASAKMLANLAVGGYKGQIHTLHAISQLPDNINLTLLALPNDQIGDAMTVMAARNCFARSSPARPTTFASMHHAPASAPSARIPSASRCRSSA